MPDIFDQMHLSAFCERHSPTATDSPSKARKSIEARTIAQTTRNQLPAGTHVGKRRECLFSFVHRPPSRHHNWAGGHDGIGWEMTPKCSRDCKSSSEAERGDSTRRRTVCATSILGRRHTHLRSTRTQTYLWAITPTYCYHARSVWNTEGPRKCALRPLERTRSGGTMAHSRNREAGVAGKRSPAEDQSHRLQARRRNLSPGVETAESAGTEWTAHASNPRVPTLHPGGGCSLRPASAGAASWLRPWRVHRPRKRV